MNDFKNIRKATPQDIPQIKAIWEVCFTTDQEYIQQVFTSLFPVSTTYVYSENEQILSTLMLVPLTLKNGDHPPLKGKYLYGVATAPEGQGKQLSVQMVQKLSNQLQKEGDDFIITHPASESLFPFYHKQGFTINVPRGTFTASEQLRITLQEDTIDKASEFLFRHLSQTYSIRFEWPIEVIKHMIQIGEFNYLSNTSPSFTTNPTQISIPKETPFALLKALSPTISKATINDAFFNFPME